MAPCLAKDTKIGARGLAYGLTEVEDFSIRLLGPTGCAATGRSAAQQGFGLYGEDAEEME
jgi:hypothetical protein